MTKTYTLNDVKASYQQKKDWEKQFPVSYYIFRPLSFPLAAIILRLTESPSRVAWVGFSIGLAGCAALLFQRELTAWPGVILLLLCALSDAVDGNIARTTKSVTHYGKFLDGMLGAAVEGSYPLFLGLGLFRANPVSLFIVLGAMITIGWYFGSLVTECYSKLQGEKEKGLPPPAITADIQSSRYRNNPGYVVFINLHAVNLQLLILGLSVLLHVTSFFLLFFAAYYVTHVIVLFSFYMHRAGATLK